jgi:hypothetical protein
MYAAYRISDSFMFSCNMVIKFPVDDFVTYTGKYNVVAVYGGIETSESEFRQILGDARVVVEHSTLHCGIFRALVGNRILTGTRS